MRPAVEFLRWTDLDDLAKIHDGQPVGQGECLDGIVGQDQDRHRSLDMNSPQILAAFLADSRVEPGQRLVQDQQLRLGHQRPRQGRSQSLGRCQLARAGAGEAVDPQGGRGSRPRVGDALDAAPSGS